MASEGWDEQLLNLVKDLDILAPNKKKVVKVSHELWAILAKKMPGKMKPNSIFMLFDLNRKKILTRYIEQRSQICQSALKSVCEDEIERNKIPHLGFDVVVEPIISQAPPERKDEDESTQVTFKDKLVPQGQAKERGSTTYEDEAWNFRRAPISPISCELDEINLSINEHEKAPALTSIDAFGEGRLIDRENNTSAPTIDANDNVAYATFKLPWAFFEKFLRTGQRTLASGWADEFNSHFETVFTCAVRYKFHVVYYKHMGRKQFTPFLASAVCKSIKTVCCNFKFCIREEIVEGRESVVHVTRRGFYDAVNHEVVRRFITGERRKTLGAQLQIDPPSILKLKCLKEASERLLEGGNRNAAPSTMLLQKIASENQCETDLDVDFHRFMCKLRDQLRMKEEWQGLHLSGFIQAYCVFPFYTVLFTEKQIMYLIQVAKKKQVTLHLDATGSIIEYPPENDIKPFYYALTLAGDADTSPFPLLEFITCSHTITCITTCLSLFDYFLKKYRAQTDPLIFKIETDFSFALIQAVLKTFNDQNIVGYLVRIWDELQNPEKPFPQITIVHVCSTHLIHAAIKRIKIFTPDLTLRKLLGTCMAMLLHTRSLPEAATIIKMCQVLFGTCKKSQRYEEYSAVIENDGTASGILEILETITSAQNDEDTESGENFSDVSENEWLFGKLARDRSPFTAYFNAVIDDVNKKIEENMTEENNSMYVPKFMSYLSNFLLPYYPLWSGIVLQRCGIARDSNATAETWFKGIKALVFRNKMRQKIPRFIQKQESLLLGRIKDRKYPQRTSRQRPLEALDSSENLDLAEEQWFDSSKSQPRRHYFTNMTKKIKIDETCGKDAHAPTVGDPGEDATIATSDNLSTFKEEIGNIVREMQAGTCMVPWENSFDYPMNWEQVHFYVFGILISKESLQTLLPNAYIDDNIINASLSIMCNDMQSDNKPLIFDSVIFQNILRVQDNRVGFLNWAIKHNAQNYNIWILPLCNNSHWVLFLVVFPHKEIIYLDSLHGKPSPDILKNSVAT